MISLEKWRAKLGEERKGVKRPGGARSGRYRREKPKKKQSCENMEQVATTSEVFVPRAAHIHHSSRSFRFLFPFGFGVACFYHGHVSMATPAASKQ